MAKKEDRKKQKKRLREQKRAMERRQYVNEVRRANRYPRIKIIPDGGEPEFIAEIERLVGGFSFDDPDSCPEKLRKHYESIAAIGLAQYYLTLSENVSRSEPDTQVGNVVIERHLMGLHCHFGEWLFRHLPPHFKEESLLKYFFRIRLVENRIEICFDLLETVGEPGNPLYLLPEKPTVVMNRARWQVGLYRHALEQMCVRLNVGQERSYITYLHLHGVLNEKMVAYEPINLTDGNEALRIDIQMPLTTAFYDYYAKYTRRILGLPDTHSFSEQDVLYTVIGYLPLHVQGLYARAKTFLLPGFYNTPEFEIARRKAKTPAERLLLRDMTDEKKRTGDLKSETVEAIKWYHDNGVPQVFPKKQ